MPNWWSNDPVVEDEPKAAQGDWWKSDPVIGEELSDSNPPVASESGGPHYVPAELQQFAEQAAIEQNEGNYQVPEWLKDVVPQAIKLPAKVAIAGGAMQTGRLHWPTDEEVETPLLSPEVSRGILAVSSGGLTEMARAAQSRYPQNTLAQIAGGVTQGVTDTVSGFSTPENLALLPIAPGGKLAQRAIAGVFLGQAISGTPEQWEAFNNAPELADKIRIATSMGLGYGLPALGVAHSFRKPPKVVEPVKTTQEARSADQVRVVGEPLDVPLFPKDQPSLDRRNQTDFPQPESISPAAGEARSKISVPLDEVKPGDKMDNGRDGIQTVARVETLGEQWGAKAGWKRIFFEEGGSSSYDPVRRQTIEVTRATSAADVPPQMRVEVPAPRREIFSPAVEEARPKTINPQQAFEKLTEAFTAGARDQAAQNVREGKFDNLTYRKPETIDLLRKSDAHEFIENADGSLTVTGVRDSQGNWVRAGRSQSIQPGIESALAEIQRRNAPTPTNPIQEARTIQPGETSAVPAQESARIESAPLPAAAKLVRDVDVQTHAIPENRPGQIPESIRPDIQREASEAVLRDEGISGRTEGEPRPETVQGTPSGIKNAAVEAQREAAGLPEVERIIERRGFQQLMEEAKAELAKDSSAAAKLVEEINANERTLVTDKDVALLAHRTVEVENAHAEAIKAVNERPGDPVALEHLEKVRNDLQKVYDADDASGTPIAQALSARRMMVRNDFSLARMEAETRAVVNKGRPLTPKQANEVRADHQRIVNAESKLAAYEAMEQFNAGLKEIRRTGEKPPTFLERQAKAAEERIIARRGKLFADPIGVTQIAHLADEAIIGAAHIARGVRNFSDWSKTMLSQFGERIKPYLPALFKKAQSLHSEVAKRTVTPLGGRADVLSRTAAGESPFERQVGGDKKRIRANIAKIEAKTAAGDFEPTLSKTPRMDREKAQLLYDYQLAKDAYFERLYLHKRSQRSGLEKAGGAVKDAIQLSRSFITSFDLPPIFRQAGFITFAVPKISAKAFPKAMQAIFSPVEQFRIHQEIKQRPNAPFYRRDKLALAEFRETASLRKAEENFMSRWIHKIPSWTIVGPILRGAGRGYTTLLNLVRADAYDMMAAGFTSGKPTPKQGRVIASAVNDFTGRSSIGGYEKSAEAVNTLLFAPRLMISRFRVALGAPLWKGDIQTRKVIGKMYGRYLAGMATVYSLGLAAGGKIEADPRSSDFGKIQFGKSRLDVLSGLVQPIVFMARMLTGETKDIRTGAIKPLRDRFRPLDYFRDRPLRKREFKEDTAIDVVRKFGRSKASPTAGQIYDILQGEQSFQPPGTPVTPLSVVQAYIKPINVDDVIETMEEQGMEKGSILTTLSLLGNGLQTYSERRPPLRPKTLDEAMAELRQGKIKEFLTGK